MSEASPLELQDRLEIPRIALAMRLRLGRGGLYIFAVESEDARQAVISALTREINQAINTEVTWREVQITPERYDLFLYLQHLVHEGQVDTRRTIFSVTGLPETMLAQQKRYPDKQPPFCVNALNVRREVIPDLNISVVLWVDEATRRRLPYEAKDFWAFQMETRFFRDAAARQREHFSPPPPVPLDEEIAELRELLTRYHAERPEDYGAIGGVAFDLGVKLSERGRLPEAEAAFQEALRDAQKENDSRSEANALNYLGFLAQVRGESEQAQRYHQDALGKYREVGDVIGQATALNDLGRLAQERGESEQAQRYYQDALGKYQEVGSVRGRANA
ncbi:MAG: tetratricopeptide repeat protein, partial [Candidatus Binatia bacterium]